MQGKGGRQDIGSDEIDVSHEEWTEEGRLEGEG